MLKMLDGFRLLIFHLHLENLGLDEFLGKAREFAVVIPFIFVKRGHLGVN
jgi:hypothetical protein